MRRKYTVSGQPSWRLVSSTVEAFVTEQGGHLGPVTFDRAKRKLRPFSVAPWSSEAPDPSLPPIIRVLRGDFICLPFGSNSSPFRGERHPVHGETANARWKFESLKTRSEQTMLHLSLITKIRRGRVDKYLTLIDGHDVLYCRHELSGMRGPMNPGHHAMLKFPDSPGSGIISTSKFVCGQVFPGEFEAPERKGYSALKRGAQFNSLRSVPTNDGGFADLTRFPARRGFEDLVMIVHDETKPFAWNAVTFPGQRYVWFALKNPGLLRETIFWISNGGRYYPPWNGRHVNVMGIEDVTAYFHFGLAESAGKNPISSKGFPTSLNLSSDKPLSIPYIMGVASIPAGFDQVASITATSKNKAILIKSASGKQIRVPVRLDLLS